jgi:hypothetical protein
VSGLAFVFVIALGVLIAMPPLVFVFGKTFGWWWRLCLG